MSPVHFMGKEIGWFITDQSGVCRYLAIPPEIRLAMIKGVEQSRASRDQAHYFDHMGLPCTKEFIGEVYRGLNPLTDAQLEARARRACQLSKALLETRNAP